MKLITLLLFLCFNLFALEQDFNSPSFEQASESQNFLKFQIESTKVGLFTSKVDGYVKEFKAQYDWKDRQIHNAKISFKVKSLDTDSRNEKMWDLFLDYKKSPALVVTLKETIKLGTHKYKASMNVRGKEKDIILSIQAYLEKDMLFINGKALTGFSLLEMPDPSIAVASVADGIKLEFSLKKLSLN